ncbi:MAG: DUF5106 domain-containing protein [Bacteroidetes bacterium]|nr:DUF5106 domain-containing protein [Bacteroidota bacterium]
MKHLFGLLVFFVSVTALGQTGYKIEMKINGLRDTTAYLGYYYGESTYLNDTARVDTKGSLVFDGKKSLGEGVYFLVLNKTRIFEFVVGKDQFFSLETSTEDYIRKMKVVGDEDNRLFFEGMLFNGARNEEAEPFVKVIRDSLASAEEKKKAEESLKVVNEKVISYQDGIISNHPTMLTTRIMKSTRQIQVPDPPKNADGRVDSTFQFKYYRKHYWDNFNLADDGMIRLPRPVYQEKIREYLTRLVPPVADSVNAEIDRLAAVAKSNQETYKYFIWMCVIEFQNPKVMGLDAVYVHLIRKYFNSGEMDFWMNATMKKNLKDRADQLGLSMIGMKSQNLIMLDQNKNVRNMHELNSKYTILYIFDPDCGHCRQETPKLVDFYNKYKTKWNLEVFAVSADTSMQKMKDFIRDYKMPWITVNGPRSYVGSYQKLYDADQTPSLYIIDERKKIIAKKPPIEELVNFFTNQEKMAAASKPPAKK